MARYIGPKAKIARKFGENIFGNSKISKILEKKNYTPGQHGPTKQRRSSNYGLQLHNNCLRDIHVWNNKAYCTYQPNGKYQKN